MNILKSMVYGIAGNLFKRRKSATTRSRSYTCQCGKPVFFRNSACLSCGAQLGYDPELTTLIALEEGDTPGSLVRHGDTGGKHYQRCANFDTAAGCNWLLPHGSTEPLCRACCVNRTIPDQSDPQNQMLWGRIELAKRRLMSQLLDLGLPALSKEKEDPEHGLAFDFLRALPDEPPVMTGHANGVITLNVEEADDAVREKVRAAMHEPYRTLLGHLRHEVGHYYWDRLIWDSPWLDDFRTLFGDERESYADALKRHYDNGAPADWDQRFVSTYASSHPWEDWAETWAHYLHIEDTLVTALSFGLGAGDVEIDTEPFTKDVLWQPDVAGASEFLELVNAWVELTGVLNELSRSMGVHDFYPFVLNRPVVAKLQFIHCVVREARAASRARTAPSVPAAPEKSA
jgi:hypothetical protein